MKINDSGGFLCAQRLASFSCIYLMKTILSIAVVIAAMRMACAAELETSTDWLDALGKVEATETLSFIESHKQDWPVLRSPSWIERQAPAIQSQHKNDKVLAFAALRVLHSLVSENFARYEKAKPTLTGTLLAVADSLKTKGGYNNDIVALAFERVGIHVALSRIATHPSDAKLFAPFFVADSKRHIDAKLWLKERGDEDAWLFDKMERIDTITDADEQRPFGVPLRLAQGVKIPVRQSFSFSSMIENPNVVRLLLDSVNIEFNRLVGLPLVIDYIMAGGITKPVPENPIGAAREKLGEDMSKYYHKALRQGNASASDVWSTLYQMASESLVRDTLIRWLE